MALTENGRLVGHEGSDDVEDLRQARDADAVRLAQQRVEKTADEQGVLEVVDFLEQLRREGALPVSEAPPRARYQTFHSSKDSHRRFGDLRSPCT